MKTFLKRLTLLVALPICALANFTSPASADSTSDLILNTKCEGGYNVRIWRDRTTSEFKYRATGPLGDLNLDKGTRQPTEGVQVYRFSRGVFDISVWDGTLDSAQSGSLDLYQNKSLIAHQNCTKT